MKHSFATPTVDNLDALNKTYSPTRDTETVSSKSYDSQNPTPQSSSSSESLDEEEDSSSESLDAWSLARIPLTDSIIASSFSDETEMQVPEFKIVPVELNNPEASLIMQSNTGAEAKLEVARSTIDSINEALQTEDKYSFVKKNESDLWTSRRKDSRI
jgi:hypothetical protein